MNHIRLAPLLVLLLPFITYAQKPTRQTDNVRSLDSQRGSSNTQMIKGLGADGPDIGLKDKLMLFGQFVGDWVIESQWFLPDGSTPRGKGEVHLGWILNGTAIQDVWTGEVENPPPGFPRIGFGTTIRFFDPKIDAWQIIWVAPVGGVVQRFVARAVGDEIILEGKTTDGRYSERWIWSAITPRSFQWRSLESEDNGKTWKLQQKISARRVGPDK